MTAICCGQESKPSISLCNDDCEEYLGVCDLQHDQECTCMVKFRVSRVEDDYNEKGEKRYTLELIEKGKVSGKEAVERTAMGAGWSEKMKG
jgi:hypothetical protein